MWQDVIDYVRRIGDYGWFKVGFELLLIGAVVYAFLSFLKGTRGLRLMRGLIVVLVAVFLILKVFVDKFQLERINVLFVPLLYMIFFGSLVVFQPELRRALMRLGEARWLRRLISETARTINPVISAVRYLSAKRIGAIIAIERQVGLGSIIDNGVKIDATLSSELLRTIFQPGSALHDLGVIVQEERIAAAACQFPLTESGQLDPALGSRHRAAVGLTEDSDAVVIIVSEETGTISLAVDGTLYRDLSPQTLKRELTGLLQADKK